MPKKIIILGFPHCGTSILKSVIGHIPSVHEIIEETSRINIETEKEYALCKIPTISDRFFEHDYQEYIKIIIIRNPLWIFSSLNKRLRYRIPPDHSIDNYIRTCKYYLKYKNENIKNVYTIKYEDIFEDNFKALREILDEIGLKYTDDIFINEKFDNKIIEGVVCPNEPVHNTDHARYKTWQINQPFINNNFPSKLDLSQEQIDEILKNQNIRQIYPNIQNDLKLMSKENL